MASLRKQAQFNKAFQKSGKITFPKGTPRVESSAIKAAMAAGKSPSQAQRAGTRALAASRSARPGVLGKGVVGGGG